MKKCLPKLPLVRVFLKNSTGHLHDHLSLRALCGAADAMVTPSRQDNLANKGVDDHACATPVTALDQSMFDEEH